MYFYHMFRQIAIALFLFLAFVCPTMLWAQSFSGNKDRFSAEYANWILSSKYQDAAKIANQWTTFYKNPNLPESEKSRIAAQILLMPSKGFRSPVMAYLLARCLLQFEENDKTRGSFLDAWGLLIQQKDNKTALALLENIDAWQYNRQLMPIGNYRVEILGDLLVRWPETVTAPKDTLLPEKPLSDGWDTEAPLSTSSTEIFEPEALWQQASKISSGPVLYWSKPQIKIKTGKDSLLIDAQELSWNIKDRIGRGVEAVQEGVLFGYPGAKIRSKAFEIIPRVGQFVGLEDVWSADQLDLAGQSKILIKRKAGNPNYLLEFRAKEALKNPMIGKQWSAHGRLWILGNRLGLLAGAQAATLEFKQGEKTNVKVSGPSLWVLPDESVEIAQGTFVAYIGMKDSLTHSAVRANWVTKDGLLRIRKQEGIAAERLLFEDSYHQVRISADVAMFRPDKQKIDFYRVSGKSQVPAWVESFDFYSPDRTTALQGSMPYNPMRVLYNYLTETKKSWAYLGDIAAKNKRELTSILPGFLQYVQSGYMNYQAKTDEISFTKLGRHYAQVSFAQKDFDRFYVPSYSNEMSRDSANITVDLFGQKLVVRGITEIMVSDSLRANFIPSDKQVVFSRGRDFDFQGEIKIGNYRFRGPEFKFNFSTFSVDFPKIDSITFFPRLKDGSVSSHELGGQFKYGAGSILLSPPNNKSGRLGIAAYPKLIIPTGVMSYFDEPWRAKGAYGKDFYFKVPRIELDSLTHKEITFEGTFYSGNVLSPIKTSLVLMPDQSFGFKYTGKSAIGVYKNQGQFTATEPYLMDKKGLHSAGTLHILGLNSEQKESYFYPDSLIAQGIKGNMSPNFQGKNIFPEAKWAAHAFRWDTIQDSLFISPIKNRMSLYGQALGFEGDLVMHNKQVFGHGRVYVANGVFTSDRFDFTNPLWRTKQADMRIGKAIFAEGVAMESVVATQKVVVKPSQSGDSPVIFPYIAYQSSLSEAIWDLKGERFRMTGKSGFELSRWYEDSTARVSDSLQALAYTPKTLDLKGETPGLIRANTAEYDLKAQFLQLGGVNQVAIGSALVFPAKGLFGIQKDGQFKPFTGAKALLDPLNQAHKLADLHVIEANSDAWKGVANYLLPRSDGDTVSIPIKNFEFMRQGGAKAKSWITAEGLVPEKTPILLSAHQQYKGEVSVNSSLEHVIFKGFIRPLIGLKNFRSAWIPFENTKGESPNLVLNAALRDEAGRPVTAGIFINADNKLYPTFLGPVSDDLDPILFSAEGNVNEKKDSFEIIGKTHEMRLFIDQKRLETQGPIQLITGDQGLKAVGKIQMSTDTLSPHLDTWVSLQYAFPATLLKVMGDRIVKYNLDEGLQTTSADEPENRDDYMKRVDVILGKAVAEPIRSKMDQNHLALDKVSPEFAKWVNFSNVRWNWSANTSAFYSLGGIPLVNVGPVDINSTVKGYMEVIKKPNKEEFYGYWELSEDLWYYFAYFNGELGVYSSDNSFLAAIREAVKNEKGSKDKNSIRVVEAAGDEKDAFVKRFLLYYRQAQPAKKAANGKKITPPKEAPKTTKPKAKQGGF